MHQTVTLQDIATVVPGVLLDIRYATPDNFTSTQLYKLPLAQLRPEPLEALAAAAEMFAQNKYRLVIFDAFRPQTVQAKLRTYCSDTDYVMPVSNHCRGITIDITLADQQGMYIDMGTDYDDFSPRSHPGNPDINQDQTANRLLLSEIMQRHGFVQHPHEWWHFDYKPNETWDLIGDETNAIGS